MAPDADRACAFWADEFDMDLPRVLGGRFDEALGDLADTPLWTHGGTSRGRLNHPSVWPVRDGLGMEAFFSTTPAVTLPDGHVAPCASLVECTWREAVRDAWPHTYVLTVDGRRLWNAHRLWSRFNRLMFGLRGWSPLPPDEADDLRGDVLVTLHAATRDLRVVLTWRDR